MHTSKIFNKYNEIARKKLLEILSLFFKSAFPEKEGIYQSYICHLMLLEGQILFNLSFSFKVKADRTDSGFPKPF